jgi:hypothetical protein
VKGRARRLALVGVLSVVLIPTLAQAQDVLNCDDFASQAEAQESLRENPDDPDGLDGPPGQPSTGTPGLACEDLPPPRDEGAVPFQPQGGPPPKTSPPKSSSPKSSSPEASPPKSSPPKASPSQSSPPPPSEDDDVLLEAGGDLPLPQQSNTDNASGNDGRFPMWRIAGIILSAGVFAFAGYLFLCPRR